jgi:nicotinamidase-related amidase
VSDPSDPSAVIDPLDLASLVDPAHTAVVTMELQRGLVGDLSTMDELLAAADERQVVAHTAALLAAGRPAGVAVVHCLAAFRSDRAGSFVNSPLIEQTTSSPDFLLVGSDDVRPARELDPRPGDVEVVHTNGYTPFTGTTMDVVLRSLGIRTIVATGVTLNAGIIGLCLEAVALGYRVVVPADAVVGMPVDYGDAVLEHSIPWLGVVSTTAEIIATWAQASG